MQILSLQMSLDKWGLIFSEISVKYPMISVRNDLKNVTLLPLSFSFRLFFHYRKLGDDASKQIKAPTYCSHVVHHRLF